MTEPATIRLSTLHALDVLRFFDRDKAEQCREVSRRLNSVAVNCPASKLSRHAFDSLTFFFEASTTVGNFILDGTPMKKMEDSGVMSRFPSKCCPEIKELSAQLIGVLIIPAMPADVVVEIRLENQREGYRTRLTSFSTNRLFDAEAAFNCLHLLSHIADLTMRALHVEYDWYVTRRCISPLFNPLIVRALQDWRDTKVPLFRCGVLELTHWRDLLLKDGVIQEGIFRDGIIQVIEQMRFDFNQADMEAFPCLFGAVGKFCKTLHLHARILAARDLDQIIEVVSAQNVSAARQRRCFTQPSLQFFKDPKASGVDHLPSKVELKTPAIIEWPRSLPPMEKEIKTTLIIKGRVNRMFRWDHYGLADSDGVPFTVVVKSRHIDGAINIFGIEILLSPN